MGPKNFFFAARCLRKKKDCGVPCGHVFDGLRPYLYVPAG